MDSIDFKPGSRSVKNCVLIVAHPNDETLWAGGTILTHPAWNWFVICLCHQEDTNREPRFRQAMTHLNAQGIIGNLDDGPEPLPSEAVEKAILELLPDIPFDLVLTHNTDTGYNRHIRHEETGKAVINLWETGKITTKHLWLFAYGDQNGRQDPMPIQSANIYRPLSSKIWNEKYKIMTDTYGFSQESREARITPQAEAFWQFKSSFDAKNWLINGKRL